MRLLRAARVSILMLALLAACDASENSVGRTLIEVGSAAGCDAAVQPCRLAHERVELRIELANDIRTLQPFQLQLQITGIQEPVESVVVEFFMEGMEMGINRYRLLPGERGWHGEITLPVCVTGRSDWRAVVEVNTEERRYRGLFGFHSSG